MTAEMGKVAVSLDQHEVKSEEMEKVVVCIDQDVVITYEKVEKSR